MGRGHLACLGHVRLGCGLGQADHRKRTDAISDGLESDCASPLGLEEHPFNSHGPLTLSNGVTRWGNALG